jgi:GT2 family glycosyltransferase/glycosyltransferase involved in cell wall biosynthesis
MLSFPRRLLFFALTLAIVPVLVLLAAAILFFNGVHLLTRFTRRPAPRDEPPSADTASIVILNWNGKELLAEGIPSVLAAVQRDGRQHEVIVVDNGSTDGSVEFLRTRFPEVRLITLAQNVGFAEGNNAGVSAARNDIVILLNNDMTVDPGFIRPLLEGFGPETFAVSCQIHFQNPAARREETGRTTAVFRRGLIDYSHTAIDGPLTRSYYPVFWAGGGSSAFDRKRFLLLGGFSRVYSPAYVEDADLSFHAWKAGWEVLLAPDSVVYHKHRASTARRFSQLEVQCLIHRNQLFFIWKNIQSWRLLVSHCCFLPWNCYRIARDHGLGSWKCLVSAVAEFPAVQIAKFGPEVRAVRTDREIFALMGNPGLFFSRRRPERSLAGTRASGGRRFGNAASRPRVLWVTAYLPHVGRHAGAGRMYQLLKRISPHYKIRLLSFLEHDDERAFLPEVEDLCEGVQAMRRVPPPRWQVFPYEPFDEFRTPQMEAAVGRCLGDYDVSLIQLEYSQMACYADPQSGIPTLLTKHEVDFAACVRRARNEARPVQKLRWFYNYLQVLDREIRLLRRVSAAICMTEPDAEELRRFCNDVPVQVISTGVDLDFFVPPEAPASSPRLVFVGAFQHLPNVDAMIHFCRSILPRVQAQVPGAELCIVGSCPPPDVVRLGEMPGVQVTGTVPDIRPFMASSMVYVVPLRLGVGIRGKILEAWGMGMPVVATSVASSGLRFENGENLLLADEPDAFAGQIVSLLRDPHRRERLGRAGRKAVEQFYGWDAAAGELMHLYEHYMTQPAGRPPSQ